MGMPTVRLPPETLKTNSRPDIIIFDLASLIKLVQADALHYLQEIGSRVMMTDTLAVNAIDHLDEDGKRRICAWLDNYATPHASVPVILTDTGFDPKPGGPVTRQRDDSIAGDCSDFTFANIDMNFNPLLVIYEKPMIPIPLGSYYLSPDIDMLTTSAFIDLARRRGVLPTVETHGRYGISTMYNFPSTSAT